MRRGLAAVLLLALACARPARLRYEERLEETPPAAVHAIHAQRLAEVMRGMERLVQERLPRALDAEWERERRAREIAGVAAAIAASAREIPADGAQRSPESARDFARHALELERRASALARDAPDLSPAQLGERVDGLREACAACHERFRDGPEPGAD